jgi:hypothetical protein
VERRRQDQGRDVGGRGMDKREGRRKIKGERKMRRRKNKGNMSKIRNKKEMGGYYGHFTFLSTLHIREKLFC